MNWANEEKMLRLDREEVEYLESYLSSTNPVEQKEMFEENKQKHLNILFKILNLFKN